jgi:MscS family membrane protein
MFNRRIYETIGLRYQDADHMAVIVTQVRDMLSNHDDIDLRRTLIVNFVSFGPSSLDFFVYAFTKTTVWVDFHQIKEEILLKILHIIHANGADVAFPTQSLQIEQLQQIPPEPSL